MIRVERFDSTKKELWDGFVRAGKNATFLFERDYMDYHSDRFSDYSLMIHDEAGLISVLPANITPENTLVSHAGLTYGGFVFRREAGLIEAMNVVSHALKFLAGNNISTIKYKHFPRHYNTLPADEMDYILFLLQGQLYRRDTAIVVDQRSGLGCNRDRRQNIKKANKHNLLIQEDLELGGFWNAVLEPTLMTNYGQKPVHTVEEISLLKRRFPDHIRQYTVYLKGEAVAGTTIYETSSVAHAQYSAATEAGRKTSALSILFDWLIRERYRDRQYFDFGTCNGRDGSGLNTSLVGWKESYGGRCVAHDFYTVNTQNYARLIQVSQM